MTKPSIVRVEGYVPAPQGSKTAMPNGAVVEVCKRVKSWRAAVTDAAVKAGIRPFVGPVEMRAVFVFPRPKSHFGTGANADKLKSSAPYLHSIKPDISKLLRSTEDALTNIAYTDDSRIAKTTALKRYASLGELPGALIVVQPLNPEAPFNDDQAH